MIDNKIDYSTEKLRYNFVFFFARYDFWRNILGEELYNNKYVRIYKEAFPGSKFLQKIFHYNWACSVNQKICLPFKRLWFKKMYNQDFEEELPIVFVYLAGSTIYYGKEFLKYVKEQNPDNKNMMLYEDLIGDGENNTHNLVKDLVDLEVTYDKGQAEKFGIEYFQEMTFSKTVSEPENIDFEYDVYFLGAEKGRLKKIHEIFNYLVNNGLKCKFIVTGVSEDKQIDGIEYSNGITYEQNLQYVIKSKCILEVIQDGSCDITVRAREAIAYRRRLLTDCPLNLSELFNTSQLIKYENPEDIDVQLLKREFCPDDYEPVVDLNPLKRLYFIQDKLENKIERE